ncbi:hypothetical protein EQZ01_03930 [Bacillus subtilis]|uniref:hypothetical protein n=1 Tax=Bacillus subtilis TaxID=1423 RepID=UPI0007EA0928|nr:hypothetical protein [Bacillus subtilis]MCZ8480275.1 hypothetical protein [Bacillus subtilis]QAT44848.1 hypothetical protein EQZ01_03930 [Bacillus subtilis]
MMNNDVNSIVKEIAELYGVNYDLEKTDFTIRDEDGNVNIVDKKTLYKSLGVSKPQDDKWSKVSEKYNVSWDNHDQIRYVINDATFEIRVSSDADKVA